MNALLVGVKIAAYIFMMALGGGLTFKGENQKMLKSNGGIYR